MVVAMVGFSATERRTIESLMDRFNGDGHALGELVRVERADMPGYNGRVVPRPRGEGFEVTMYLAHCAPFTIAHELAHIADIRARRRETRQHLSLKMPETWHLAHRMSCEYVANRLASLYVEESEVFAAFQSDHIGLAAAARDRDWTSLLIYYALILGLFHGLDRHDCDPARLLSPSVDLPRAVVDGMAGFRADARAGFEAARLPQV
jgi:hypothetical protein